MKHYNILHLEDSETDADLVKRVLERAGIRFNYVLTDTKEDFLAGLDEFQPDIVISDHTLPRFNSKMAFVLAKEKCPDIPFLLVTGTVSEEFAVDMIKTGIDDYILKSNLQRLPLAFANAFLKKENEERVRAMRMNLQQSETHLRTIFENSIVALILLDRDGLVLELNDRARYFTYLTCGRELTRKDNLLLAVPANRQKELAKNFLRVLQGEKVQYEAVYPQPDSLPSVFQVNFSPATDDAGLITGACLTVDDITERKRNEQAIKESELLNRSILTSIRSHIAVVDENGLIIDVNDAWTNFSMNDGKILERTGKGSNYLEVCQKAAAEGDTASKKALKGFQDVKKQKVPFFELIYPCHSPDEERWFQLVITRVVGDSGRLVINHTDITQLEKASREAADYKKALDQSSILAITDQKGVIIHVNDNFCNISQYSPEELIGKDHRIVNSTYHSRAFMKDLWSTIGTGKNWRGEICNRAKDGTLYWVDTTIVPFLNDKGKPFQYLAIRWDITKKKLAETMMQSAIERYDILSYATSDTIWDWDIVKNTMIYNDGISTMFGYKMSEVGNVIQWWNERLHAEDLGQVKESLADIFEKGTQRFQLTYRFRCSDGSFKNIFDRAFVIFDEGGKPIRVIGAMQDITYQVQEEMRITKATIDAQEQERNHLGAELHDNINQILAGALLTLGVAKSNEAGASKQNECIDIAKRLITDAINETRKLSHNLAPAGFDDIFLKDLFYQLLNLINIDNRFRIKFEFDDFDNTLIQENIQINLYRIFQEQTKNIVKYAEASVIEVTVTLAGNRLFMRIYDNGKGFNTRAAKKGIGLSNIKKRLEALSGKFTLNSAPGEGCELLAEIPLVV